MLKQELFSPRFCSESTVLLWHRRVSARMLHGAQAILGRRRAPDFTAFGHTVLEVNGTVFRTCLPPGT